MASREICSGVVSVGAIDWHRRLFDALIPLPSGTSYNSYLVRGSNKTALIDTVEPAKLADLMHNLDTAGADKVDYVIANHAEQDHSGSIPAILKRYPEALLVTNAKCKEMLQSFFEIKEDRIKVIEDGQTLDLGGRTLKFIFAPWVHWPETMLTYLAEEQILFSCDLFGSHLATSDLFATDEALVLQEAKRYYAQIMMPYVVQIRRHQETLKKYPIKFIAPSHGPVYNRPALIEDAYRSWTSETVRNEVLLAYVSMHESTEEMALRLTDYLMEEGVSVRLFNLVTADLGEVAGASVEAATICLASPAVLAGAHPLAVYAAYLLNALKPKTRYLAVLGSYSWGSRMTDQLKEMLKNIKAEMLEPVFSKGFPKEKEFAALKNLAKTIAAQHKAIGALPRGL